MKAIETYNFKGKKALIRVDFNVPLDESSAIIDDSRMVAALTTIKQVIKRGGIPILMSHLGRPKHGYSNNFSLKHLCKHLSKLLETKVLFAVDCIGQKAKTIIQSASNGQVVLLENLRFHDEEKNGDLSFSKSLSELGDVYINDAFGTAHRAHSSTTIVAQFFGEEKMFGYLINQEIKSLSRVLYQTERPFTAIMGGAKISGKIEIINHLMEKVDNLIIGGAMTFTFIKAMGGNVGTSLVEEDKLDLATEIINKASDMGVSLILPVDSINAQEISDGASTNISPITNIPQNWMGLDIGPKTVELFREIILNSKTILWNGPMGVFETKTFELGTKELVLAIAEATLNGTFTLVGGGDSVAAVNKFKLKDKMSYVSTGGGALLEFIEGKTLPGIEAITGQSSAV